MDVPIVFSNDGFHSNIRRQPRTPGMQRIVSVLIHANLERYTIPYRYRIRLTNMASRQLSERAISISSTGTYRRTSVDTQMYRSGGR
jgi:hypothetical protein